VSNGANPEPIEYEGKLVGRRVSAGNRSWIHLTGLTSTDDPDPAVQTKRVYERAARVLREQDMGFRCVARTWVWLRDILAWYRQFNIARTDVYEQEGLVAERNHAHFLPASTGIGVAPADGGACGLELIAISDGRDSIHSSQAAGEQCSAFSYGSAFARAVVAPMPSGEALLVSGTAAIDPHGVSEHPGDVRRQIEATIQHIRSLVTEAGWSEEQIVSAIGYCKNPDVAGIFAEEWRSLPWPRIEIIGEVCREELLFEMEVMAADRDREHR
jgi:enamine deaminase RidA (YjgF/YER057c/UK114 family)